MPWAEISVLRRLFKMVYLTADKLSTHCELPPIKKISPRKVFIGESHPNTCTLSAEYMPERTGFQPLLEPVGNYLCVFVLGWSYVLSAHCLYQYPGTMGYPWRSNWRSFDVGIGSANIDEV